MKRIETNVREWPVSYYRESKWMYGTLQTRWNGLLFQVTNERNDFCLKISFDEITDVMKTRTGLIFNALLIRCKSEEHWFSSINNRDSVYYVIFYFWKQYLLEGNKSENNRAINKEMLKITQDSETCLAESASVLKHQGDQITNSLVSMDEIHNDLDISRRLLYGISGSATNKIDKRTEKKEPDSHAVINRTHCKVKVLYATFSSGCYEQNWSHGVLLLNDKGINIVDDKDLSVLLYGWRDISRVKVITNWEILVSQFLIGVPDKQHIFMATQLYEVIKVLRSRIANRIESCLDSQAQCGVDYCFIERLSQCDDVESGGETPRNTFLSSATSFGRNSSTMQTQLSARKEIDTSDDIDDISRMLTNMKSLAVDISHEQDKQNEALDTLGSSVDRANVRLKEQERFMKKL